MAVVMVVTAMLVVLMVMAVIMRVVIVMTMRMMMIGMVVRMIMRGVVMRGVVMGVAVTIIGAAFGVEWRFDLDHPRAQSLHHFLDHMVTPDAKRFRRNLRRQMTVAEMPGDADQLLRILAADFEQRLRRRDHLDQTAILEHQRIAAAQRRCILEIEQEFEPTGTHHRHPPAVAIVEIEHNRIGRRFTPAMMF
jgi:hypothetical protein